MIQQNYPLKDSAISAYFQEIMLHMIILL